MNFFKKISLLFVFINLNFQSATWGLTFTEDFSTTTYYDSTSSTGMWNTGLQKLHVKSMVSGTVDYLEFGDGSDGDCNFSSSIVAATYQCKKLTISGTVNVTGATALVIKVLGDATIDGILNLSGGNGNDGSALTLPAAAGAAGPGGFAGGSCLDQNCTTPINDGAGSGKGIGGTRAPGIGLQPTSGAGGGGGIYGPVEAGPLPSSGATGPIDNGIGDDATAGTAGSVPYGNQDLFLTTLVGGSGGGAGGAGDNNTTIPPNQFETGGSGGGGGGALHLVVAGTLSVNAAGSILASGGDGGNGIQYSGAGGGGSGGAIFIQSAKSFINNGTVLAIGGSGGTGGNTGTWGGDGGNGGKGRIRLDVQGGTIGGTGPAIDPVPQNPSGTSLISDIDFDTSTQIIQTLGFDASFDEVEYNSLTVNKNDNGGSVTIEISESDDDISYGSWVSSSSIQTLSKRYIRFKLTLLAGSTNQSPEVDSLILDYQEKTTTPPIPPVSVTNLPQTYTSSVSCGEVKIVNSNDHYFFSLSFLLGLIIPILIFSSYKKY